MEKQRLKLLVYGADWCPDARRARKVLDDHQILYEWHNIDHETEAKGFVEKTNGGKVIIPVIVFPDGSILIEPSNIQLEDKLSQYR